MSHIPQFTLRKALHGQPAWALGSNPQHIWHAPCASVLLGQSFSEAWQQLQQHPEGILVGLLPYPDANPSAEVRACLMLFRDYVVAERLPTISAAESFRLHNPFQPDTTQAQYLKSVLAIKNYLAAGDAYQVNLAQRFSSTYEGHPWHAFVGLAQRFNPPHAAWFQADDITVISLSPELFLQGNGQRVETHPIKGTRPRHADTDQDHALAQNLQQHPKDRAENLMIVDLLRNDLGKVCETGSISVPDLFRIESHPNVHHLVSTVCGQLKSNARLPDLLQACFPGGSITGAPKRRAMQIITELEPHARTVYCGSIFWVTANGEFGSNILIRTFLARDGKIHGWAGAGIVFDSDPQAEYQECLDKLQPMMRAIEGM